MPVGDMTLSNITRAAGRHRGYVAMVLALLLLVASAIKPTPSKPPATAGLDVAAADNALSKRDVAAETDAATVADPTGVPVTTSNAPGADVQPRNATVVSYPGVGTPAALAAPDCDPRTKRLKMASVYAPPCVPLWKPGTNNGGSTAQGVTATEIKIVWGFDSCDSAEDQALYKAFDAPCYTFDQKVALAKREIALWARHVETYGRRVVPIFFQQHTNGTGEEGDRADAITIAQQIKPFFVLPESVGFLPTELAKRGIPAMSTATLEQSTFGALQPYLWGAGASSTDLNARVFAEWIAKRLAGHPTQWAADPTMRSEPRRFGLVYPDDPGFTAAARAFEEELAKRGVKLASKVAMSVDTTQAPEQARTVIARFKQDKVTTVVPFVNAIFAMVPLTKEATNQQFFPEWAATDVSYILTYPYFIRTFDPAQRGQFFGITTKPVEVPEEGRQCMLLATWEYGPGQQVHPQCLIMPFPPNAFPFVGIQLAGPTLTIQTFQKGMFSLPPVGGAATGGTTTSQVSWGTWPFTFGIADLSGRDDYAEAYFDQNATDPNGSTGPGSVFENGSSPGVLRFLNGGTRFVAGGFTGGLPKMFDPAGTAISVPTVPPADKFDYENKKNCANRWECFGA
jgi:hypothetical protein